MFSFMSSIVLISIIGFALFEGINEVHCNECHDALNLEFENAVKPLLEDKNYRKLREIFYDYAIENEVKPKLKKNIKLYLKKIYTKSEIENEVKPNLIKILINPEIENDTRSWFKYFITHGGLKKYQNTQFIFLYGLYLGLQAETGDIWHREKFCTITHGCVELSNCSRRELSKRIVTANGMVFDYKLGIEVKTDKIENEMVTGDDIILKVKNARDICHNDLNDIGIDLSTPPAIIFNILYNLDYNKILTSPRIQNYIDHAFGVTKLDNVLDPENFCTSYKLIEDTIFNSWKTYKKVKNPYSLFQNYDQHISAQNISPVSRDGDVGSSSMHRNIE